ncbi:MAG: hypothetical protein WBS14_15020, partial [Rhodomicrobium sp.]
EKLGISVLLNDTAAALHGQDKVQAVETTSGRRIQCADVVVVAGGLGLAPVRPAIYRIMANRRLYGRVTILFGSHNPVDILYREELRLIRKFGTISNTATSWWLQWALPPPPSSS